MNQALLIIHADESYLNKKNAPLPRLYLELFDKIAKKLMPQRRAENFLIYALPESTKVYKKIRAQNPIQIPYFNNYPYQCLKLKEELLTMYNETKNKDILEAQFVVMANDAFHKISDEVLTKYGMLDNKKISFRWKEWLKKEMKKRNI